MNWLKQFLSSIFRKISPEQPKLSPLGTVLPKECVSHFIFEKSHIFPDGTPKPAAFRPWKKTGNISIYRVNNLFDREIWGIAEKYIDSDRRKVIARVDLLAFHYYQLNLKFEPDGIPHPRHANVIGWPPFEVGFCSRA
ncbi:MAG: hypothetical protein HY098_05630 [Nitrospinae bacterium]|nr:hypothetical protein [Nitrospinota bacterium]